MSASFRSPTCEIFWPSERACWNLRIQSDSVWPSPSWMRLRHSTPPTSARLRLAPLSMPAASMVPIMLVEQAMMVEKAGMVGGAPASISTSRAMLLHVRLGTTVPHTKKSGSAPPSRVSICCTSGTDRLIAS